MAGLLNTPSPTSAVKANGFYSFVVTIPDDDVYEFTPVGTCGHIFIASLAASHQGLFWWRGSLQSKYAGAANTVGLNSALTGTTGTDGNTTLGASGGKLYIENRSGGALEYVITLITENSLFE
jgi:hypothetical protein